MNGSIITTNNSYIALNNRQRKNLRKELNICQNNSASRSFFQDPNN